MLLVFIARKWMLPNGYIAGTYQPRAWSRRLNLLQALFLAHRFDRSLARACFCSPSVRSSVRNRAESRYDRDDAGGNENMQFAVVYGGYMLFPFLRSGRSATCRHCLRPQFRCGAFTHFRAIIGINNFRF